MTLLRRGCVFLLAAALALAVMPADAASRSKRKAAGPVKDRYAAIVLDARTGEILHEVNADAPRHPASITKIMTLYLTFEALEKGRLQLDQQLPVSANAAGVPWGLPLRPGMTISVEEAILGLITKSANNAATVLAETMSGTESAFAQNMTLRARRLGMSSTIFRNASGLPDPRQITTARDFTVLARAMLRDYPKYYPYFATRGFTFRGAYFHNHNRLLDQFDGLDGIKTGFVNASGYNLVASAERGGRRLIGVVMGGNSAASRDIRMAELLEASFAKPAARRPEIREARGPALPPAPSETFVTASGPAPAAPALGRPEPMRLVVAAKEAHVRPAHAGGWREEGGESWAIQVGAYSRKDSASRAIQAAQKKAGKLLRDSTASVMIQDDRLFRARFGGLEERDARNACKQLGERTFPCAVIPPGAASIARAD